MITVIKKRFIRKMYFLALIMLIFLILFSTVIKAPPSLHNVIGRVFTNDSDNGVENGVPVRINNTVTGELVLTYVYAPPVPTIRGSYATAINGNDEDLIIVFSWNRTHFGNSSANLESTTTTVNLKLNVSRPSEANVTILEPSNNTIKNKSMFFNITANITILGNDGIDCNATISFSDDSIINVSYGDNFTRDLGDIALEDYRVVNWTLTGYNDGSSNISITAVCESDGRSFEDRKTDTASNITIKNLVPRVSNIAMDQIIDLNAGDNITLLCNATITDYNKNTDIKFVNATFYQQSIGSIAGDDNNNHYSNSSCTNISSSLYERNYTCGFQITYYANNGTWECNFTATDESNTTNSTDLTTLINELLAIDISPNIIEYGNLKASNITQNHSIVTITNLGNIDFNLTLRGFGGDNESIGQNVSMLCEDGNITFDGYHRYYVGYNLTFPNMINLTNRTIDTNFTLPQRTNDTAISNDTNATYWKLEVPSLIKGMCNGTIVFGAISLY
ncbi:hypothetical protein GOV14_01945 [Candidatus Pacearchaeota archaeon]|nr:hypothetical protein [Candidatus Pacearchaeota archaeon]